MQEPLFHAHAAHRGRLECSRALLRAGADPNYTNSAGAAPGGLLLLLLLVAPAAPLLHVQCMHMH